jgi:hypothetical protein
MGITCKGTCDESYLVVSSDDIEPSKETKAAAVEMGPAPCCDTAGST